MKLSNSFKEITVFNKYLLFKVFVSSKILPYLNLKYLLELFAIFNKDISL